MRTCQNMEAKGAHVWNSLPDSIKHETSMSIFKGYIKKMIWPKMQMLSLRKLGNSHFPLYILNFI